MSDRDERGSRIAERLKDDPDVEDIDDVDAQDADADNEDDSKNAKMSQQSKTEKTSKKSKTSKSAEPSVKELEGVMMYLPADLRNELDARFDELNAQHKREHGEALEKNRDYYVSIVQAGLEGEDVEDVLDL